MLVDRVVTTPTREQFAEALSDYWDCSILTGAILFAQFAFETGWGKYCYCWNLGNVRADKNWIEKELDYFDLPGAWEYLNGKKAIVGGYFRAHKNLQEGMASHIKFLSLNTRYSQAFDVLKESKNVEFSKDNAKSFSTKFAIALKRGGYFTGSLEEYIKGTASISSSLKVSEEKDDNRIISEYHKIKEPDEWGPITVCQAFEKMGMSSVCSIDDKEGLK